MRRNAAGLSILYAFTAISIAGFATFGVHPDLLARLSPASLRFYSVSFRFFAIGQVWLAGIVIAAFLTRHAGRKWIPALLVLYAISLVSELTGTGYGIPFGSYSYSAVLKPMWLGRVPIGIPLSWFYMALPAYAMARAVLPGKQRIVSRIGIASLVLLAWDLALDPAMSSATKYWAWADHGPYYGMPLLNLFGWYVTGITLMTALHLLGSDRWIEPLPVAWLTGFYGANVLLAAGLSAAAGLWGAVALTIAVLAATYSVARILANREPRLVRRADNMVASR